LFAENVINYVLDEMRTKTNKYPSVDDFEFEQLSKKYHAGLEWPKVKYSLKQSVLKLLNKFK